MVSQVQCGADLAVPRPAAGPHVRLLAQLELGPVNRSQG